MIFNSFAFIIFLPLVFLCYWFVFSRHKWQNVFIVVASYIFYGWWDYRFLALIAITTASSFASGLLIDRSKGASRKLWLTANIVLNLLILATFKYYNFFTENFTALCHQLGWNVDWPTLSIILPVGISFYTFQALSYSIDVYQRKLPPTRDVVAFFAYISFFPQLVAGPIERATNLLPQFLAKRSFNYAQAVDGCRQMLWGFVKKVVIADNCAVIVNQHWEHYQQCSGIFLMLLAVLFTFQIYCDFSGYSDIAIGCARLFGIHLMQNFNHPYLACNIPDFWRKWHISLTSWMRDYIYFPLGGSRCGKLKTTRNVYVVWAISGLWHGANWTFVCWGLYHATLLTISRWLGIKAPKDNTAKQSLLPSFKTLCSIVFTFMLVVVGWILFRAESMTQAIDIIKRIVSQPTQGLLLANTDKVVQCTLCCLVLIIVEWTQRHRLHALQLPATRLWRHPAARLTLYAALVALIFIYAGEVQTFIYFQF